LINYLRCCLDVSRQRPRITYQGRDLDDFDAVIPRIGATYTFFGTAVVRQFEMMGVFTANSSQAIALSRDKLSCLQLLSRVGIGLPVTGFAHATTDVEGLLEIVGGVPVVIKLLEGTQGAGVILAETKAAAEAVIEAFHTLDANILVQEFIAEAQGSDLRCFVIGDQVVAAMLRKAPPGEFRSNLHRGGTAVRVAISDEERNTALSAARVLGLQVAGVDILRSHRGPVVTEVNSSPGLEGIERTSGVNVAEAIIRYLEAEIARRRQPATPSGS
jgi:ribosomal protein S6--L-glutamate ligase